MDGVVGRMGLGINSRGAGVAVDAPRRRFDGDVSIHELDACEVMGGNGGVVAAHTGTAQDAHGDGGPGSHRRGFGRAVEAVHGLVSSSGVG